MGKKGNKLAKMSEEERARYLQLRADIEEEARRRKIQLISLYMKNKLKREEAFCRLNMAKINQEWRSILRQIKCQEMHKEMKEVAKFCKETLERKNRVIAHLLHELDVAEEMYSTLQHSHVESVLKLISTQKQRMEFFQNTFEQEKTTVLNEWKEDFENFKSAHESAQMNLECVAYNLEDKAEKEQKQQKEWFLQRLNDVQSEMQIRLEKITTAGEAKLERLWQEYQNVLSAYVQHTQDFYAEYMDLKERDEENTSAMRDHCYEIEKATNQLAHLKLVAADTQEKADAKISYLTTIHGNLRNQLAEVKLRVDQELKEDQLRFKLMSVESHNAIKHMKKVLENGETLLQLSNVCVKMQTEKEKLFPLGLPPLNRKLFEHEEQDNILSPTGELKEEFLRNYREMDNFWTRVNNVAVEVICLKERKKSLEEENAHLKTKLQEYLLEFNINNGSNLHINNYLANRPSSMHIERVSHFDLERVNDPSGKQPRRPITSYVEANYTSAVRSEQLARGKQKLASLRRNNNW